MSKKTPPYPPYPEWTEARFFQFLRSGLRRMSMRWPPKAEAKKLARRAYTGANPRMKWEYHCRKCKGWFPDKEVEVNHIVPVGELKALIDLPVFVGRLFCGVEGFEVLCNECHQEFTHGSKPL